jgi:cytochrome c peroxidase
LLHNTGIAWRDSEFADAGAGLGNFKTPTLREVARTAPYMHDGSLATLEDVIEYYDRGGNPNAQLDTEIRPLHLSAGEKNDIITFLRCLNGIRFETRPHPPVMGHFRRDSWAPWASIWPMFRLQ